VLARTNRGLPTRVILAISTPCRSSTTSRRGAPSPTTRATSCTDAEPWT
jgi:hypothetical protein